MNTIYETDTTIQSSIDRYLVTTLLNLEIPAKNQGFVFAKECAKIIYFNPVARFNMNELVFKEVANRYNTSVAKVERSIRHTITIVTTQKSMKKLQSILNIAENFNIMHPSVCEFLCVLAESISFMNNKY